MYLHSALIRDHAAERHADDLRRAAEYRRAHSRPRYIGVRSRARDRAGPRLRLRLRLRLWSRLLRLP
jgi:hypothetical protein